MFDAFAATLNCTGPAGAAGAVHSTVHVFMPVSDTREPIRLCCTKVSALSTAPGMSCTRVSCGVQLPACRPLFFPEANRAAISKPPRRRPSRCRVTVIG